MKLIVAVNNHGYIGNDGKLMWRCREDLQHFKKLTMEGALIVGATTFEQCLNSKRLPGRTTIVVGKKYNTMWEAIKQVGARAWEYNGETWVIGGQSVYNQLAPICDEIHISHINDYQTGDTKFEIPVDYRGKVFHYYFEPDGNNGSV